LIFSFNTPEHLNVTIRLASIIMSSPVWGFRPLRSFLSFTQNLPKPLIRTSSLKGTFCKPGDPDDRCRCIFFGVDLKKEPDKKSHQVQPKAQPKGKGIGTFVIIAIAVIIIWKIFF